MTSMSPWENRASWTGRGVRSSRTENSEGLRSVTGLPDFSSITETISLVAPRTGSETAANSSSQRIIANNVPPGR